MKTVQNIETVTIKVTNTELIEVNGFTISCCQRSLVNWNRKTI